MKRLVLKKWVEVMFSFIAIAGLIMCWVYGNKDLFLSVLGAGISMSSISIIILYGNN